MTADASSSPMPSRGGGLLRHRDLRLLPAGVWVDRLPRRPVLVGADLVRGAALLTVPWPPPWVV